MSRPPLPDGQREIVARLGAGERIIGPREVWRATSHGRARIVRPWTWRDGRAVHSASVNAVLVKRIVEVRRAPEGGREIVLTGAPDPMAPVGRAPGEPGSKP